MDSARVVLHPLTFVAEGDEVIVGRAEIESYALFPPDAADVVRKLRDGATLGQAAAWYAEEYGEQADIGDLVETLRALGFVREPPETGADVEGSAASTRSAPGPGEAQATRFRRTARLLFSPTAWTLYAAAIGTACYAMVRHPWLRPGPSELLFGDSLVVLLVTVLLSQLIGIAWHESFHVMAARRLGVPARVSIGRRLYFLVFQTTLTGLMGVERTKRILPFCAGLLADALYGSMLIGLAWACHGAGGLTSGLGEAAMTAAYLTVLRMSWQFLVFMETDLYYVLVHVLRCPDLHALSRTYLRNHWWRLVRRPERVTDQSGLGMREQAIVRVYAPLMFGCGTVMLAGMLVFALPAFGALVQRFAVGIASWNVLQGRWWDSIVALAFVVLEPAAAGAMALRAYLRTRRSPHPVGRSGRS